MEVTARGCQPCTMIVHRLLESFGLLATKRSYMVTFYLMNGTILGCIGAFLENKGLSHSEVFRVLVFAILPVHVFAYPLQRFAGEFASDLFWAMASFFHPATASMALKEIKWVARPLLYFLIAMAIDVAIAHSMIRTWPTGARQQVAQVMLLLVVPVVAFAIVQYASVSQARTGRLRLGCRMAGLLAGSWRLTAFSYYKRVQ